MRTKTLLCLAALTASVATTMAQSNVYSLNIVGYANVKFVAGNGFYNNPLNLDNVNNASNILNIVPPGGSGAGLDQFYISIFTCAGFNTYYYESDLGGNGWFTDSGGGTAKPPPTLPPGTGFILQTTLGAFTNTFVGNVMPGPGQTNSITLASGTSMHGSILPLSGAVTNSAFHFPNANQNPNYDQFTVSQFTGSGFKVSYYESDLGQDGWFTDSGGGTHIAPPNVAIGESYYISTSLGPITWTQSLPSQ